ncbi:MAG TPA: MlaD family protein [Chthoniobacterales bacterium]|jgi:ABC-type transporter Mla subunit MlaD|nr:MlaD family protein [Chthoniobacterales bacterium]
MQIIRSEIRTGILVILTVGLLVGIILYLSAPGLFRPIIHYRVFFDDAAAIKPGANVTLAGRKIGTVDFIQSPVPVSERPPGKTDYEAVITVQVSADAQIFKENNVTMRSFGLLAEPVIDFTQGNPKSGRAVNGDAFVGVRSPDLGEVGTTVIQKLDPTLKEATGTFIELHRTAENLTRLTAKDSNFLASLDKTLDTFQVVGRNLQELTAKGGSVDQTLQGVQTTLNDIHGLVGGAEKGEHLEKTLANFDAASGRLKSVLGQVQQELDVFIPKVNIFASDMTTLSGKVKEQPWRLIWPSTIKYQGGSTPTPLRVKRRSGSEANN